MNANQENKLSMYYTTQTVVNENNSVWSGLPAYVMAFNAFETKVEEIGAIAIMQGVNITGISKKKAKQRDVMVNLTLQVSKSCFAYGSSIDDDEVRDMFDFSRSDLRRPRDSDSVLLCQRIWDDADAIGTAILADFGVDNAKLNAVQAAITAFADIQGKPRAAIGSRKTATAQLKELFKEADVLLNEQLDSLMENFVESDPMFYNDYFNARIIVDLGSRKTVVEGTVLDAATATPIAGATVKLTLDPGEPEEEVHETVTDELGGYEFESMKAGEAKVKASANGYKDGEETFVVESGRVNVVDFLLEV